MELDIKEAHPVRERCGKKKEEKKMDDQLVKDIWICSVIPAGGKWSNTSISLINLTIRDKSLSIYVPTHGFEREACDNESSKKNI